MIHPNKTIRTELYIHAASVAVWQKFIQLHDWPQWYPAVRTVQWLNGERWQEGSRFAITTPHGQTNRFVIRMVSPESVTVWESLSPTLKAVYSFHCTDQVGGCKVTMSCTFHGFAALTSFLQSGRRRAELRQPLVSLKDYFDRK